MTEFLILAAAIALVYFGFEILARLPKLKNKNSFVFEVPDERVVFEIDAITEKNFDVSFVDGWNIGRSFMIGGRIVHSEDNSDDGQPRRLFGSQKRCVVTIGPSADWFKTSSFGIVRTFKDRRGEISIWLPHQVSNRVLDEVRHNPKQLVSVGYKRETTKKGEELYRVYSFELSDP